MGTRTCPACKGTGKSKDPMNAFCMACGGSGEIDTPDDCD
jgi:DnaJ-class molecular chaperone